MTENAEEANVTLFEKAVHDEIESEVIEVTDQNDKTLVGTAEEATVKDTKISDEVCPDKEYEEVDDDVPIKQIVLERACQEDLDEEATKDLDEYNFKISGINMLGAKMEKSESGVISLTVIIQPKPKEVIEKINVGLRDWKVKQYHG
jgi:hypothetical protein